MQWNYRNGITEMKLQNNSPAGELLQWNYWINYSDSNSLAIE